MDVSKFEGHTPKPWAFGKSARDDEIIVLGRGGKEYVCSVVIRQIAGPKWWIEEEAKKRLVNAQLIICAPELLAENAALRAELSTWQNGFHAARDTAVEMEQERDDAENEAAQSKRALDKLSWHYAQKGCAACPLDRDHCNCNNFAECDAAIRGWAKGEPMQEKGGER